VTDTERRTNETSSEAPVRRTWEPMSLTRVGTFGDVLRGNTGPMMDGATLKL
jgi:hypothetical protein